MTPRPALGQQCRGCPDDQEQQDKDRNPMAHELEGSELRLIVVRQAHETCAHLRMPHLSAEHRGVSHHRSANQ